MCGIAGIIGSLPAEEALALVERMSREIAHRGPDDAGSTAFRLGDVTVALAHRRLSILDLSIAGHQPMALDGDRLVIVYNGEIYNYLELRAELQALGRVFRSGTDTEVLLHAYDHWGRDCLTHFNGMFSFSIWDREKHELFCAIDHAGIKPFYYLSGPRACAFASEIKALVGLPWCERRVEPTRTSLYALSGIARVDELTMLRGVKRLLPGHAMVLRRGEEPRIWRWWHPTLLEPPPDEAGAKELLRTLLRDSIRLRYRSDVPVGITLSGGVDSSTLVCTAADMARRGELQMPHGLRTFTATTGDGQDEGPVALRTAKFAGATAYTVQPSSERLFREDLAALVRHQDEPFISLSVYMQFAVMRLVRETGTVVVLSGQGPDELFAGYPWQYPYAWLDLARDQGMLPALREVGWAARNATVPVRSLLGYAAYAWLPELRRWRYKARSGRHLRLLGDELRQLERSVLGRSTGREQFRLEVENHGLPALLRYEDRNSMAFGVESRLPYLDPRLMSLAHSLPSWRKFDRGWSKALLRHVAAEVAPPEIARNKRKIGFSPPDSYFLDLLRPQLRERLAGSPRSGGLIDAKEVTRAVDRRTLDPLLCWRLLNIELWMDTFGLGL